MKKLDNITVLITGAGAPGAPGIIKSLRIVKEREIRIIGVDSNLSESIGVGLVDKSYEIPPANDNKFITSVMKICATEKVSIIIPLVTRELFVFAKNKEYFNSKSVNVIVSDYENLLIANNKYLLMDFCKKKKIPYPNFYLVKNLDEFISKSKELGYPKNKICFKPPISNGLRGFRIINDSNDKMDNLINSKPNNVYIGYDEFIQIANDSNYFPELLLMEYLPGKEYSVDVLVNNGKCIAVIPRSRDKIKMGISFVGTTVKNDKIIEYSKKIVEKLKLHGNIGLQFKEDINGIPKIIESNPRVQGTIVLCTAAGYNMVYNAVKISLGEQPENFEPHWGIKMVRYWSELFFNRQGQLIELV